MLPAFPWDLLVKRMAWHQDQLEMFGRYQDICMETEVTTSVDLV